MDQLCGKAICRLRLSVDEFYDLIPVEFDWAIKMRNEEDKEVTKTQYMVARFLAKHIWNSRGRWISNPIKDPKDLGLFDWEVEPGTEGKPRQTIDEMKMQLLNIFNFFSSKKKK